MRTHSRLSIVFALLVAGLLCLTGLPTAVMAADGDLDLSFGLAGTVITDFNGFSDAALAAAIQSDGKIVGAGFAALGSTINPVDFALARYEVNP